MASGAGARDSTPTKPWIAPRSHAFPAGGGAALAESQPVSWQLEKLQKRQQTYPLLV